tara:strand:- start:422 stop:1345 length:924 start_codon:yes stop_codon:yes gene_type:complete
MQGPWYTLDTTKQKLSLTQEELFYHIEKFNIYPVVFTKEQPFLLFKKGFRKRWIGVATCLYRGPFLLHGDQIFKLLDDGEVRLGEGIASLKDRSGVKGFNTDYPFKSPLPLGRIYEWQEPDFDGEEVEFLYATPMPKEQKAERMIAHEFSQMLIKHGAPMPEIEKPTAETTLNFQTNSLFKIEDIRFAASEIERLLSLDSGKIDQPDNHFKENNPKDSERTQSSGKRVNQLHQLILRALHDNQGVSATSLWKIIQRDAELDCPLYDIEAIIIAMDSDCIEWRSLKHVERSILRSSFDATVSKLRSQL